MLKGSVGHVNTVSFEEKQKNEFFMNIHLGENYVERKLKFRNRIC